MAWLEGPDGARYPLKGPVISIGRDRGNDLVLADDSKVSRSHAELQLRDGQWMLVDLGSSNGTTVGKRKVEQHPLRDGDQIQLGRTTLVFAAMDDPNITEADAGAGAPPGGPHLSEREREILDLIAQGLTDRDIGVRLFISASTVRSHLDRIGEKTGLRRRAELTRLAIDLGIVS